MEDPETKQSEDQPIRQDGDSVSNSKERCDQDSKIKLIEDAFEILSFWYRKNLSKLESQLSALRETCDDLSKDNAKRLIISLKRYSDDEGKIKELEHKIKELVSHSSTLEEEKRSLTNILSEKRMIIQSCREFLQETRKDYSESMRKSQDMEQQKMGLSFSLSLSEKECEQLKKNNEWLWSQLDEKSKLLLKTQSDKDNELGKTMEELQNIKLEKDSSESKNSILQKLVEELENKVKSLMASNSENEGHFIVMKGQFQSEMDSMSKLCEMYDSDLKVSQKHIKRLETKLGKMTSDLEALKAEHEKKTQALASESKFWKAMFDEAYESNEALKLSADDKKSESAPCNSHNINILPGRKTYTELYIDYESEKEKRISAERQVIIYENRLNETIDHLMAKKEYIMDIEQEKNRVTSRNDLLFKKLSQEIKDKKSVLCELELVKRKNSSLETEQAIMKSDINDLIKQIRSLAVQLYRSCPTNILSIENYVGDLVSRYSSEQNVDCSDIQKEIEENFVETSNIEDIVRHSFLLRKYCKELKVNFEKKKIDIVNENEAHFNDELRKERKLLEESKKEVEGLENKLRYVLKQRNDLQEALKRHLKESDNYLCPQVTQIDDAASITSDTGTVVNLEQQNDNQVGDTSDETFKKLYYDSVMLQKQFDEYIKESGGSVKNLSEKLESLRTENTEKSVTIAKINSQVKFQNEKYSLLLSGFEALKQENLNLRERVASLSITASENEDKLQSLIDQLSSERVRAGNLEAKALQVQSEKQVWQDSIERISNEKKDIYNERNRLNNELIEIRFKFNDVVNSQKNDRRKYEDQILDYKEELGSLRKELTLIKDEKYNLLELKTAELKDAQNKISQLKVDYEKLKNNVIVAQQRETELLAKLQEKTSRIVELDKKLSLYVTEEKEICINPDTPEAKIKRLEFLLAGARKETLEKQEDIEALKQRESVLKELAENSEKQLLEFNTTYDVYKETTQRDIKSLENESKELKDTIDSLNSEIKVLNEKLREGESNWDNEKGVYEKELDTLKSRVKILEESEQKFSQFFENANSEMQSLKQSLTSAQDCYEKELISHSSSLTTIQSLKTSLEEVKSKLIEKIRDCNNLEDKLSLVERSSEEIKERLENDVKDLQKRNDDLMEQNKILHSQFSALEKTVRPGISQLDSVSEDDQTKSITELRELVSLVQRDRDVADAKCEVVRSENARLTSELTHARTMLDQERARFEAVLETNALRIRSESKHLEIMEKIKQNNILSESNATLRTRLEESEKKVISLSESIKTATKESQEFKEKMFEAQAEVEVLNKENALLSEELNSYKNRTVQVIQHHKHMDPIELENLKESLSQSEKKCTDLSNEKEEALKSLKSANEKNCQLVLVTKRQKEALLSKAISINEVTENLKSKSEEIESLQTQQKVLKDRLSEAESKLQQTIHKANATMLQFKDKNRSLLEERRYLELQVSTLKEKIGVQQEGNERIIADDESKLVSSQTPPKYMEEISVSQSTKSEESPSPVKTVTQQQQSSSSQKDELQHSITQGPETPRASTSQLDPLPLPDSAPTTSGTKGINSSPEPYSEQLQSPSIQEAPKPRHTKEELDSLRLKYNDLLSQIEGSKMTGKLQFTNAASTSLNSDRNWGNQQLKIPEHLSEPEPSVSQYVQKSGDSLSIINNPDVKVISANDSLALDKRMKLSHFCGDKIYAPLNIRTPPNITHNIYQHSGVPVQTHAYRGTQLEFPNFNKSTLRYDQIEPGEISETDSKYLHNNYLINNMRISTPSHESQLSNISIQNTPSNITPTEIRLANTFSFSQKVANSQHHSPSGTNLKLSSISKSGSSLTPHQRAQLLKRKLEAAEAELASPSVSPPIQKNTLPVIESNSATDNTGSTTDDSKP